MDLVDILGGLLGHKSGGSGRGADILQDILRGQTKPAPREEPRSRRSSAPGAPSDLDQAGIEQQARSLEDLLNVARDRNAQRQVEAPERPSSRPMNPRGEPVRRERPSLPAERPIERPMDSLPRSVPHQTDAPSDEQCLVLIRSMVNAAKSDGQIDEAEQQKILQHMDQTTPEVVQFLREEFTRPLDVREFAWSVPLGMEQQVYSLSLMAIDLDTQREVRYLKELAQGLRLSPEICERIHQRLGIG